MKAIWLISLLLITAPPVAAQIDVDEARQAIDRGEYVKAVNILSSALAERATPDAFIYLGIAYERMREYQRAEGIFKEGNERYPDDARFHIELANLFLGNNDSDAAKTELRRALLVDPQNVPASDLLATIDLSEGDVQSALRSWNKTGRPLINDILHNYNLNFGSRVVRDAVAFHPAGMLHYGDWKTTESRLFETGNFTNVGLEIEPTQIPEQYNAVVRTTSKTNSLADFLFNIVKGAPFLTSYVNVWNIGNSGVNFNSNYRWDTNRRRLQGEVKIPIPVFDLLHLELGSTWRSERWNLTPTILPQYLSSAFPDYKATTPLRIHFTQIPHYRVEVGGGFEYRNRAAKGNLPQLYTNSLNSSVFSAETTLRLVDGRYQSALILQGYAARKILFGNIRFSQGVAELNNRFTVTKDTRTSVNWSVKTATSRGQLPIEDYFELGLDTYTTNPLRAHTVARERHYGNGPMGTDFVLVNTDVERELATIPLFNNFNIPYLTVKWLLFFDGAETWDRNRVFQQGKLLLDTGGGVKFETPRYSFNLIY